MQSQINTIELDSTEAQSNKWNSSQYPIHQELLTLVRTLDGLNDAELQKLKILMAQICQKQCFGIEATETQDSEQWSTEIQKYLAIVLKLHQVLSLIDVDFSTLLKDKKQHADDILQALKSKGGLDYVPRERTPQGRVFEHAADSNLLIQHLLTITTTKSELPTVEISEPLLLFSSDSKDQSAYLILEKDFIELTMMANGKAELYFHAYFWTTYFKPLFDIQPELQTCPEVKRMISLANKPRQVIDKIKKFQFDENWYKKFVDEFANRKTQNRTKLIQDLQVFLFVSQITNNKHQLHLIEKILVQLLGFHDVGTRDNAVVLLNSLYDETDWQQTAAFRPVIRSVGQHFKVDLTVKIGNYNSKTTQIFLGLSAPSPLSTVHRSVLTWHRIEQRNIVMTDGEQTEILINFGKFWKCGFYDWRLVQMDENGKLNPVMLTKPPVIHSFPLQRISSKRDQEFEYDEDPYDMDAMIAQGRYIIQAKGIQDQTFHEVQIDYQNAEQDYQTNSFKKRGTFADVQNELENYAEAGVTVLYLMGVFQRDNCPVKGTANEYYKTSSGPMMRKENASALAVTSRETPCEMLGGISGFQNLIKKAKKEKIKIIVDCLARISSSRHHRKFRKLLLHYLDEDGRRHICYGTDGQALKYEDTAMLNYRKVKAWNFLVDEVLQFAEQQGIDGIHLDNGQAWPQILEPDLEELTRLDVDGKPAYSNKQLLNGEIVIRNENHGYWNTNTMEQYPNPFFIKLCKALWQKFPNFMIIGECWGGFKFEHRQIILSRSGVIPRLYKLPQTICSLFGKKLHRDGRLTKIDKKESVVALKNWYDDSHKAVPEGTILLQSSTAHSWPYPAYLYGKGTWAAVDILYFMPDVPITFMGETEGQIYRLGQGSIHQAEQQDTKTGGELKRSNSQVRMAISKAEEVDEEIHQQQNNTIKSSSMPRVRSGHNLAALVVEQANNAEEMQRKESTFRREVGPDLGFDLSKIKSHYINRRFLRSQRMVLRYGKMCPLLARSQDFQSNKVDKSWFQDIVCFARFSLMETAIISINLNEREQTFYVDLENLQKLFNKTFHQNTVVMTQNLLAAKNQNDQDSEYFFLREFTTIKHIQTLIPYGTSIQIVTVCQDDKFTFQQALQKSIERTKQKLLNGKDIEAEQISLLLTDSIKSKHFDGAYFARLVGSLKENFLDKINMTLFDLVQFNSRLKNDPELYANLLALCHNVSQQNTEVQQDCKLIIEANKLGPIVFCTPELGRWSTVGGLGVMVDELSIGLAQLGQDVIVISPYYDRNRKGQTGYLALDPAGIAYVDNIQIQLDQIYTLGVHEGEVSGVKVVFLHHSEIFPVPYPDGNALMTTRQISVFSKACLEYCCKRKLIPSVCITNDWFTGFVPGYAKVGAFGPTFKGTTFLHICHNLMEDYEGRIYPEPRDGFLERIHQLPRDWLVDPTWSKMMINPSRIAIMQSDQWSTVSKSYRDDLLNGSSLAPLLRQKPQPFAFPNGIPIAERVKKLDAAAPNHEQAKRLLQKKYFNFQDLDDSIPLFAFVGRITTQKGVHLILDIVEPIISKYQGKVQFIVGGPANMKDPYAASCAHRMYQLKNKYPNQFWAAPEEFFTDGALVNRGADFGLMPSLFEPGGIVQHEFFVGGTPVIAFKTGGLKDSVIEFSWDTDTGCGYTFESYKYEDFVMAIIRAIGTYYEKSKYQRLRANAFNATMPGERVSKAWLQEFFRLRNKVYYDFDKMNENLSKIAKWSAEEYKPLKFLDEMFGSEISKLYGLDDIDFGAEEVKEQPQLMKYVSSEFDKIQRERIAQKFTLHNRGPRHSKVQLCGSFDNWDQRHEMKFDPYLNQWYTILHLSRGDHFYKYVVDEKNWVVNEEERTCKDKLGNLNNFISL